jgi:hypothetical protein
MKNTQTLVANIKSHIMMLKRCRKMPAGAFPSREGDCIEMLSKRAHKTSNGYTVKLKFADGSKIKVTVEAE